MHRDAALVDRVVDAVLTGSSEAAELGLRYFHETWDATGFFCEGEIDSGGFVPWDELNDWLERAVDEPDLLESDVTEERYAEIEDGAALSADEKHLALRHSLANYFEEPIEGWVYRLLAVVDSAGRRVVASAISQGSSFEGVRMVFMGVYRLPAEAIAELELYGLVDAKDLEKSASKQRFSEAQLMARIRETR
jgi:hypothetical protein